MSVKIFACGDILNRKPVDFIDKELKYIINKADISICNFEGPVEHKNLNPIKKVGPHVLQSKSTLPYLKGCNFNLISIANNHIYDYGSEGLSVTLNQLNKNKFSYCGAGESFEEAYQPKILYKNNIKIGFISACENEFGCLDRDYGRGGYAWVFHKKIEESIKNIRSKVDFIILNAHAGIENIDIPIKLWREKYKQLCDIGVDIVLGHHPHVPQGVEKYKKSLIFYSLGNFYFDLRNINLNSNESFSVLFELNKNQEINYQIIYHKMKNDKVILPSKFDPMNFNIKDLNQRMEEEYEFTQNDIAEKLFEDYYFDYYRKIFEIPNNNSSLYEKIKFFLKTILKKNNQHHQQLLLLHNIKIDSHKFIVQTHLSNIFEKNLK